MNPSCMNLILTNSPKYFQNSNVIGTVLSEFHKTVVIVMKASYRTLQLKMINCRKYKDFSNDEFRKLLIMS